MQFTGFVDGCGASGTRHCVDLFSGKFFGLHCPMMKRSKAGILLNIAQCVRSAKRRVHWRGVSPAILSKSEQFWNNLPEKISKSVSSHGEKPIDASSYDR